MNKPRSKRDCIAAVVKEMNLDMAHDFTKLFAIACGMQDAHDETKAALERCQQLVHQLREECEQINTLREALEDCACWSESRDGSQEADERALRAISDRAVTALDETK